MRKREPSAIALDGWLNGERKSCKHDPTPIEEEKFLYFVLERRIVVKDGVAEIDMIDTIHYSDIVVKSITFGKD